MNIDDFPAPPPAAAPGPAGGETAAIKRSFRYQQLPATVTVQAEEVVPEVRVTEQASLDISDERIVLSSRLEVSIARSGVFSLSLAVPDDYDVESLSGEDVSHWDERKEGGRTVQVHFNKQVLGTRTLNLVLARTEKGIGQEVLVPRVRLAEARKHTGTLAVSGERGVRFMTVRREGVSEINPPEIGIHAPGYLAFRLLRPGWMVALKTEVRAPVVKAEVLHRVDLSQGMIQGHASIRYQVENAGVKTFYLAAPRPGTALTVQGRTSPRSSRSTGRKGCGRWSCIIRWRMPTRWK